MNIFITGVSGLLGGEILVHLSKRKDVNNIYCLIRAASETEGIERLEKVFTLHNDFFDRQKVHLVIGDLKDPDLAERLSDNASLKDVNTIIHSAANTSFSRFQNADVEEVNINGLRRIILWAQTLSSLKTFCYVSTATICGKNIRHTIVDENLSPSTDAEHLVKYTYTKMRGEILVNESFPSDKILIVRPSIIMGDSRNVQPRSPVILWTLATVNTMRLCMFNGNVNLDIIPVDFAADAIVKLLHTHRAYQVYHISCGVESCTSPKKILDAISSEFENLPPVKFINKENLQLFKNWSKNSKEIDPDLEEYIEYCRHFENLFGKRENMRIVFSGLEPYIEFIELGQVFNNTRLLKEINIKPPVPAHQYISNNIEFLKQINIMEGAFNP